MPDNALPLGRPSPGSVRFTAEQLVSAIMRNPVFIVYAIDDRGIVTFFNAAAEKALGYGADEVVGKRTPEIWHDVEEMKQHAAELSVELGMTVKPEIESIIKARRYSAGDKERKRDWIFIRKDGSRFPVFWNSIPLKDEQGRVAGYLAISNDITQIRAQQRVIVNHEILLDAIIRHLGEGLITINDKGIVQNYNPACEELFGYEASEVIGKNVSMLMPEPDRDKHDGYIERYMKTGQARVIGVGREVQGRRKDGSVFPFDLSVNRFEIDGKVMFCGTIHDVSEQNRAMAERERLIEQLTRSNVEFERFAYVASHDMQEPLRTLSSFSDLVLAEYKDALDEDGRTYLNLIRDAALRMQALIVDLLEYARVGKGASRSALFDAVREFNHARENLLISIAGNEARVTADPLPQIRGDSVWFLRLLQNLIGNGLKYHRPGVPPAIHVSAEDKGDHWLFSVADNGIGIEPMHLARIFEPFRRLHSQREYAGTGLGLTVCKKIVENHSGKIWCVSTVGEGSTFYFTWPKG